jgi:biopolymer transport protein ExbD
VTAVGWNLKTEGEIISEINIIPLTDVMLVLLVIFMVTTPLIMMESFKIKLPRALESSVEPGRGITITITGEGALYIGGKKVAIADLEEELKGEFRKSGERTVLLKGDRSALHGVVVEVLDRAKRAGAARLAIATEPAGR